MAINRVLYLLWLFLFTQNPIEKAPKLALDRVDLKAVVQGSNWDTTMVSWVATDRNGSIYLLQRSDKADPVIVMNREGRILRSWGKGMYVMPHSIRIDPLGNVWTADAATSKVTKFSPDGKKLMEIPVGGQPVPCAARMEGLPPTAGKNFCGTTDVAFGPNGHLFISDGYANARVLKYTPDGKKVREWGTPGKGPGQFYLPHSVQVDEKGMVYVADRENARIQRFTPEGKYVDEWGMYGKTFGMKLKPDALWIVTQLQIQPNGNSGWLMKLDRQTGKVLGYAEVSGGVHGVEVMDNGEAIVVSPSANQHPQWFRHGSSK